MIRNSPSWLRERLAGLRPARPSPWPVAASTAGSPAAGGDARPLPADIAFGAPLPDGTVVTPSAGGLTGLPTGHRAAGPLPADLVAGGPRAGIVGRSPSADGAPRPASNAAVLVPIVLAPEPFVLLTRRSDRLRHHPGQVSFPGGRADPGDHDAVDTALRETQEEIGLDPGLSEVVGLLDELRTLDRRFSVVPVVSLLPATARWQASEAEVAAVFGLPLSVLLDPDAPRRIVEGPRAGSWFWPHADQDIWGATALMLMDLARVLLR